MECNRSEAIDAIIRQVFVNDGGGGGGERLG